MKLRILGISIAAALAAGAALPASAQSIGTGKVNFMGNLTDETCEVATASQDQTVTLDTVATQSLQNPGDTAGSTPFDIDVINCPTSVTQVQAHFEMTNMDAATRTLLNLAPVAGAATGVTVQLVNADGSPVPVGSSGAPFPVDAATHEAKLVYGGEYYSLGSPTAGSVQTFAEFTLAYP